MKCVAFLKGLCHLNINIELNLAGHLLINIFLRGTCEKFLD